MLNISNGAPMGFSSLYQHLNLTYTTLTTLTTIITSKSIPPSSQTPLPLSTKKKPPNLQPIIHPNIPIPTQKELFSQYPIPTSQNKSTHPKIQNPKLYSLIHIPHTKPRLYNSPPLPSQRTKTYQKLPQKNPPPHTHKRTNPNNTPPPLPKKNQNPLILHVFSWFFLNLVYCNDEN